MNEISIFLRALARHKYQMKRQEYRTLKGQAIAGDVEGARKGLQRILHRHDK